MMNNNKMKAQLLGLKKEIYLISRLKRKIKMGKSFGV